LILIGFYPELEKKYGSGIPFAMIWDTGVWHNERNGPCCSLFLVDV
jgi:hypothetical protein